MDFSSISSTMYSGAATTAADEQAKKLTQSLNKISDTPSEEELKTVLKDFESYFVEQLLKDVKETFTDSDKDKDHSMAQYEDMFMDVAIEKVSDQVVDQLGETYTQQLYEQMKRNYNL